MIDPADRLSESDASLATEPRAAAEMFDQTPPEELVAEPLRARFADEFGHARERISEGADEIRIAAADIAATVRETASECAADLSGLLRDTVRERPLAALATAAGVAFVVARLTARRRAR
jgi:ElaB/YqjD/DUF883 family membrane-anchored ribosome-binding protein